MKTAMQELIEDINIEKKLGYITENASKRIIDYIDNLYLEKEKEQIIDAWEKGYSTGCVVGSNDYTNEDEEKDNGNYYYKQTYNQKK